MESNLAEIVTTNGVAGSHSTSQLNCRPRTKLTDYVAKRKLSISEASPESGDRLTQRRKESDETQAVPSSTSSGNSVVNVAVFSLLSNNTLYEGASSGSPQNFKGSPPDQYEEDALSKINWSEGRRPLPNGLFTCLYDNRRSRGANKKSVRFVSDPKLVRIRLFEMDEEERANVFRLKVEAAEKGIDYQQMEKREERAMLEKAQSIERSNHQKVSLPDETEWYTPLHIAYLPSPLVARGKDSIEKMVLFARQSSAMSGLNLNREFLPDSPDEPQEPTKSHAPDMIMVPLSRPEMAEIFRKPYSKLEPSGLPVEEVESLPIQQPPTPVIHSEVPSTGSSYDQLRQSLDAVVGSRYLQQPPRLPDPLERFGSSNRMPSPHSIMHDNLPEFRFPSGPPSYRVPGSGLFPRSPTELTPHRLVGPPRSFSNPRPRYPGDRDNSNRNPGIRAHTIERTSSGQIICHFFSSPSGCNNGSRCKFAHVPRS